MPSFTRKKQKKWHDKHIQDTKFEVGQKVLFFQFKVTTIFGKVEIMVVKIILGGTRISAWSNFN